MPHPKIPSDAINFLSKKHCEFFLPQYEKSILILVNHFEEISVDDFDCLNNDHLGIFFSSPDFHIENENILFNLILKLINKI
jgi:hypothetical protein